MTTSRGRRTQTVREERIASFARAEAKAREVLKERGLTPDQIEAQLNKLRRQDPYDL